MGEAGGRAGKLRGQPGRLLRFRLSLALGCPHPDFLSLLLTERQVREWAEFYALEPWGFGVDDARMAAVMTAIATGFGARNVQPERFTLAHALEEARAEEGEASTEQLAGLFGAPPRPRQG